MTTQTIGKRTPFSKMANSPCHICLIKMTCTKSFVLSTACDEYKKFVRKLITPGPPTIKYRGK